MKRLRQIVRITLVTLGAIFGVVVIVVLFAAIYFGEPYIQVTEVRSTAEPRTIKVRWYVSCEEEYYVDESEKLYDPQVPIGGKYPGVAPVMFPDTEFVLVGYPYKELRMNVFTRSVNEQRSKRFDVIAWHVVTPYRTLEGEEDIESYKPIEWKSDKTSPQYFSELDRSQKGGC
ncbi:MAG TPA: hypothetical protein VIU93_12325 [Gallionellaceae bacterium]